MSQHLIENDRFFVKTVKQKRITITRGGRVKNNRTGRWIGCPNSNGYLHFALSDSSSGKTRGMYIHRLVYLIFKGTIPKGFQINHKDGNKENNKISNLEMVTPGDNIRHAYKIKLIPQNARRGENSGVSKFTDNQVAYLREQVKKNKIITSDICRLYNVSIDAINAMLRGESYSHLPGGFDRRTKLTKEGVQRALKLRKKGWSCRRISLKFNVSEETIRFRTKQWMEENNEYL